MYATPQGTAQYFTRLGLSPTSPQGARRLGRTELLVSSVGFGGYRITDKNLRHREALKKALAEGCNLIDTSTNYTDGASERLVGEVLAEAMSAGTLQRAEVVVVTKAGYVQGANLVLAQARAAEGVPFAEMVEYRPDCWHCISPDFLRDQLDRSLERLRLTCVDVLLLHNPEYFIKAGGDHSDYYERIGQAFEYLETEVERGRIRAYGISSNTLPDARESAEYTSLETLLSLADALGPENHFQVIQFPFNLLEPAAAFEPNNSGKTLLELASARDMGTLINRPLNAFAPTKTDPNRMIRLTEFKNAYTQTRGLDPLTEATGALKEAFLDALRNESAYPGRKWGPAKPLAWGHLLRENFAKLSDLDLWRQVWTYQLQPEAEKALTALESRLRAEEQADEQTELGHQLRDWIPAYRKSSQALHRAFTDLLEVQASEVTDRIRGILLESVPGLATSATLSRKALRVYRSVPGLHCTLLGMRTPAYVADGLGGKEADLSPKEALRALQATVEGMEGG